MKLLGLALIAIGLHLSPAHADAAADSCPALAGTYRNRVGWFNTKHVMVVQDGCRSVTILFNAIHEGFNSSTPTFIPDGRWRPGRGHTEYSARYEGGALVISHRNTTTGFAHVHSQWSLDQAGQLIEATPFPELDVTYFTKYQPEIQTRLPSVRTTIAFDKARGWHTVEPDQPALIPLVTPVGIQLDALNKNHVHQCILTSTRTYSAGRDGRAVTAIRDCAPDLG